MDLQDRWDLLDQQDLLDHKVTRDQKDQRDQRGLLLPVHLDLPVHVSPIQAVEWDHKGLLVFPSLSPFPRPSPALPLLAPVLPFHCLPLSLLTLPHTLSRPFFLTVECVLLLWTTEFFLLLKRYGCRQTTKTR